MKSYMHAMLNLISENSVTLVETDIVLTFTYTAKMGHVVM